MREIEFYDEVEGLTDAEVAQRIADGKVNGDQNIKTKSYLQIVASHAFTFFNALFLSFALVIIIFNLGWQELGFLMLVVVNMTTGIWQEIKAKRIVDKLSLLSEAKARVRRNNEEKLIDIAEIVQDDILLLKRGDQITADSKIIAGFIEVNESLLTGEPDPIPKHPKDEILSGSFVVSGKATAKVINVGLDNYSTKITKNAKYIKKGNSDLLQSLMKLIKLITIIMIPLSIALLVTNLTVQKGEFKNILLGTVTMMVSMIPSGLVALTTAVFAVSVIRISTYNALAQDLFVVESLARVDVLCLDKTGTITEGIMVVEGIKSLSLPENQFKQLLKNLDSAINDQNPTSIAISNYVQGYEQTIIASSYTAFSSARKWSAANLNEHGFVMGAAEFILHSVDDETQEIIDAQSALGNRVLVVAKSNAPIIDQKLNDDMTLLGFIFITDKIRAEAKDTLNFFREQGVDIKIISGDNPITVSNVARKAGVMNYNKYVDASTLTDDDIPFAVNAYTVFGRVNPDQKLAIIKALKEQGHCVGMTGDGVNDVLALKESDCSIAMVDGSDAAKNISQIVLLDNNFASLPHIVGEGRRSVNNLERSASLFLVKTIYSLLVAFVFLALKSELPYSLANLTFLGSVAIGIPAFFLALEKNDELITGKFLDKVVYNALPGALCIFLVILIMSLLWRFSPYMEKNFEVDNFKSMTLVLMGVVSFLILLKTIIPLNGMRIILFCVMIVMFAIAFYIPISAEIFKLSILSPKSVIIVLPFGVLIAPLFVLLTLLVRKQREKDNIDKFVNKISCFFTRFNFKHKKREQC